jgi:hypothetical protein
MFLSVHWQRANSLALLIGASLVTSCGGEGSSQSGGGTAPTPPTAPVATVAIKADIEFAQTHVSPSAGLKWTFSDGEMPLSLVGKRDTLAIVKIDQSDSVNPVLEAFDGATSLGTLSLSAPSQLPKGETGGPDYATDRHSAVIPARMMIPGVQFAVKANNYLSSSKVAAKVGADSPLTVRMLPFYMFGATEANTHPMTVTADVSDAKKNELIAKWPVSTLDAARHPIGKITLDKIVVNPRGDNAGVRQPAYAITAKSQQKDGYATMSAVLRMAGNIRAANGEAATSTLYYAPLLALGADGKYSDPGGGLGGGGSATGDYEQTGTYIHELGHAMGLSHAGGAYDDKNYPYVGGSLAGSAWGYDQFTRAFMSPLLPSNAKNYRDCATRQKDAAGKCYRQDPMQGGAGDQTPGYAFTMHSDGNVARLQRWFEGVASDDVAGKRSYKGGRIFVDSASATGYSRWDSLSMKREPFTPQTTDGGLYGVNNGFPIARDIPVYTIVIDYSNTGTTGASMIHAPIKYTGNLQRSFDPTNAVDLAEMTINTGKYYWYCAGNGCDFSVRITYADGSVINRVLQGAFREWYKPTLADNPKSKNPVESDSQKQWAINVPGDKAISKVELLDTPMVWTGMPANPRILLTR